MKIITIKKKHILRMTMLIVFTVIVGAFST